MLDNLFLTVFYYSLKIKTDYQFKEMIFLKGLSCNFTHTAKTKATKD